MQASFDNTVQVLVKAFLSGSLQKGNCHACAVGNICAAAQGISILESPLSDEAIELGYSKDFDWAELGPKWQNVFYTADGVQEMRTGFLASRGIQQIESTGYSIEQLARVEFAFETAHTETHSEEAEFAGLMAVVDVLADIHGIDLTAAEQAKALFVRA